MLGKLASFFVDTGAPATPAAQPAKPVASPQSTIAPSPVARIAAPVVFPGQADQEMAKILDDAIVEANIPGFDYIEFRDVLINMKAVNLPEPQTFQAAFASAQIAKVTKPQLLEAIDFYVKVIETKAVEFNDYVAGLEATEVTGKDQEIAALETQIEDAAAKIQELTVVIGQHRQQQDAIRMAKTGAANDIANKKAAFETTKAVVIGKLQSDRTKIENYIPNA